MNIDELQARFNEMRGKKWRTLASHETAKITGFFINGTGVPFISVVIGPAHRAVDPNSLKLDECRDRPFIEEISPYADWPMDAKIRVWNSADDDNVKEARHFAGENDDGLPLAWVNGGTSHTTGITAVWSHAELAEDGK